MLYIAIPILRPVSMSVWVGDDK